MEDNNNDLPENLRFLFEQFGKDVPQFDDDYKESEMKRGPDGFSFPINNMFMPEGIFKEILEDAFKPKNRINPGCDCPFCSSMRSMEQDDKMFKDICEDLNKNEFKELT